jgi:hypothetical protein
MNLNKNVFSFSLKPFLGVEKLSVLFITMFEHQKRNKCKQVLPTPSCTPDNFHRQIVTKRHCASKTNYPVTLLPPLTVLPLFRIERLAELAWPRAAGCGRPQKMHLNQTATAALKTPCLSRIY